MKRGAGSLPRAPRYLEAIVIAFTCGKRIASGSATTILSVPVNPPVAPLARAQNGWQARLWLPSSPCVREIAFSVTCAGSHAYLQAIDRDRVFAFAASFTAPGAHSRPARGRTTSRRVSGGEHAFYLVDDIPNESRAAFLGCQGYGTVPTVPSGGIVGFRPWGPSGKAWYSVRLLCGGYEGTAH